MIPSTNRLYSLNTLYKVPTSFVESPVHENTLHSNEEVYETPSQILHDKRHKNVSYHQKRTDTASTTTASPVSPFTLRIETPQHTPPKELDNMNLVYQRQDVQFHRINHKINNVETNHGAAGKQNLVAVSNSKTSTNSQ